MNKRTIDRIREELRYAPNREEHVEAIIKIVDEDAADVLGRIENFGELLDAFGLEIAPKTEPGGGYPI